MASSNLQGLNLVHPESPPSNLTDAQDLLSTPLFPDFANHLDLWTNISFASDEPFVSARDRELKAAETEAHVDSLARKQAAHSAATASTSSPTPTAAAPPQQPSFDFNRFLAEFGLSANAEGILAGGAGIAGVSPASFAVPAPAGALPIVPAPAAQKAAPARTRESSEAPAPKRARTSKAQTPAPASTPSESSSDATKFTSSQPDLSTPLNAAEDKRRRNTAASARFRLKKKEREAALDTRAQALEDRVTSLERECEGLRRENGWLRGLVVGVTGGVVPTMNDAPIIASALPTAEKRKRDDEVTA
ncbi:hypothetical protein BDV93DRAFT_518716 [Ceratobasidium sp. AG-I]|nr:hypothetical protein BDV93DRAFT_518716 [Ceratobasidium sp. AG-I]